MEFSTVALIQAAVWALVGALFLALPRQWVAPFGVRFDSEATFVARLLGAAFLSLAVLDFMGRDASDLSATRAIAYANITANALSAALHTSDLIRDGILNARGWAIVALNTALAAAWLLAGLPSG